MRRTTAGDDDINFQLLHCDATRRRRSAVWCGTMRSVRWLSIFVSDFFHPDLVYARKGPRPPRFFATSLSAVVETVSSGVFSVVLNMSAFSVLIETIFSDSASSFSSTGLFNGVSSTFISSISIVTINSGS
eukprot:GFKZ01015209.1.p1 GENE.GFKZ01015209.1~~GFKZ01015209.1.p1  ORF type:complete len:131 (-),score=4.64 GFKZ01015209.1:610-1002(-)